MHTRIAAPIATENVAHLQVDFKKVYSGYGGLAATHSPVGKDLVGNWHGCVNWGVM
ncbi:hypothetical protein SFMTTN_0903 [Sulfuriferula multivorans]|uniref:Uncharacterized protein n=1 Tax=Sulfuriferula multivorans TaxID=1559896 RepID=A0A401JBW9_9PROT|nr:hypothetical protein [Sulfuriferula multivorans]GBL45099.1 hypothetical protein SFMTTN_0903 [Sulfuriferula multivorans]